MADILIRGMEMPGCCGDCQFQASRWTGDFCSAGQFMFDIDFDYRDKHRQCPLVSLPAGHGRLIDADALDRAFTDLRFNSDGTLNHWGDRPGWCMHGYEVEKLIADAPTIVPAEGGTDDVRCL